MDLPAQVETGLVTGLFARAVKDTTDVGIEPDKVFLTGQVTFRADLVGGRLRVADSTPPMTIILDPVPVALVDGALSVRLVADPTFTWTAEFQLNGVYIKPLTFQPVAGQTVDLTIVGPTETAIGGELWIAEAVASAASAAASAASAAASAAASVAAAAGTYIESPAGSGLFIPGLPSDAGLADATVEAVVSDPDSDTRAALSSTYLTGVLPQKYGAVGNGIADDTTALNAAVAAAAASTFGGLGATVYLGPGTYNTTGLTLPDNVQLRGAGQRASRLQGVGAVTALTLGTNCVVSDLHVRGDSAAGSEGVAVTLAANHWSLVDCWVTGHTTGVYLTETWIGTLTRVTIQTCTTGLRITGSNVNAVYVMNGEIKGCVDGVWADTATASTNVTFYGCTIEGNSGYGFNQGGNPYGWNVRDCYFEANALGHIFQSVQSRALTISGNTFSGPSPASIVLNAGLDTFIEGNLFNCTGTTTAIQCAAPVTRTAILKNWYGATQTFVKATNYLGTLLTLIDREIVLPPSSATVASLNVPHGVVPTAPVNGDLWTTTAGLFVRVNGVTVGPLA